MTHPQAITERTIKNAPSTAITGLNGFRLEPRCRVCRSDQLRRTVNDLLASGASYAFIVRALGEGNGTCDRRDRVTIDSIRNHTARHFPVQNIAKATYREILERRAKENAVDFINGIATAITPMAFFETLMVKAYQTVTDPATVITPQEGAWAAKQLHEMIKQDSGTEKMAQMYVQLNRVIDVFRELPEEYQQMIIDKLEGCEAPALAGAKGAQEIDEFDPGDDEDSEDED